MQYGKGKHEIVIIRHKDLRRIDIKDIKIERFSIKMLINKFNLKKLSNGNVLH